MKTAYGSVLPIAVLSLLLVSTVPAALASTFTVTLNPDSKVAQVKSMSSTSIILTYPSSSSLSRALDGYNSTKSLSGSFSSSSDPVLLIQGRFDQWDHEVRIQNMSIAFSQKAKANATALVITQETDIRAAVSGVFTIANGTVHANLGWRSFSVPGDMTVNLGDHPVEVNLVGSAMNEQFGTHPFIIGALIGMFGANQIWHRGMLNFSSLNAPLNTWTKSYNSGTNTTTFSKTISGQATLKVQADYDGQEYTLSMVSDPSASIQTLGYASASGDSLVIGGSPAPSLPTGAFEAGAVIVAALAASLLYITIRARSKPSAKQAPTTAASVSK